MLTLASRRLTTDQRFVGIASNKLLGVDAMYMARTKVEVACGDLVAREKEKLWGTRKARSRGRTKT